MVKWPNGDVSKTQGVSYVTYIFFWSSLVNLNVPSFIIVEYRSRVLCRGRFFSPLLPFIHMQFRKSPSWIGLRHLRVACVPNSIGYPQRCYSLYFYFDFVVLLRKAFQYCWLLRHQSNSTAETFKKLFLKNWKS